MERSLEIMLSPMIFFLLGLVVKNIGGCKFCNWRSTRDVGYKKDQAAFDNFADVGAPHLQVIALQ